MANVRVRDFKGCQTVMVSHYNNVAIDTKMIACNLFTDLLN